MLLGQRSYAFKPRAGVMLLKEAREPTYAYLQFSARPPLQESPCFAVTRYRECKHLLRSWLPTASVMNCLAELCLRPVKASLPLSRGHFRV